MVEYTGLDSGQSRLAYLGLSDVIRAHFDRGNLNGEKTDLTGTPVREGVDRVDEKRSSPQASPP